MRNKLKKIQERFEVLERLLQDEAMVGDGQKIKTLSQEYEELAEIIKLKKDLEKTGKDLIATEKIIADNQDDEELKKISEEELENLKQKREGLEKEIRKLMTPTDPNDKKNAILEIRAGAGGDESALFAAELFRMYSRYAENRGWKRKIMTQSRTDGGGFKEIIIEITGQNIYSELKYESGVHRVQRVPETEKRGRVHTSTVTVAVLPEAEEIDLKIDPKDLRIDVFRSGGHGGQSVNTTDSAVRVTYLPTNTVVTCQDEKSQHQNRDKALRILRTRILAQKQEEENKKLEKTRRSQIGTGDRSEKIRTYNFPQDRITDHRIKMNFGNIESVLNGELDKIIQAIKEQKESEKQKD